MAVERLILLTNRFRCLRNRHLGINVLYSSPFYASRLRDRITLHDLSRIDTCYMQGQISDVN